MFSSHTSRGLIGGVAVESLETRLGYRFSDRELVRRALVHPSWRHENGPDGTDNQRLEFLGDAVLSLAVSDLLFSRLTESPEGELTRLRARLVCTGRLAEVARDLGLGASMALGRGEQATGGADKDSILAAGFEAVLGAVYEDGGFEAAMGLVTRELARELDEAVLHGGRDPKSALQEQSQREFQVTPRYRLAAVEGPPHEPHFTAEVEIPGHFRRQGQGASKKEAERSAAAAALESLAAAAGESAPEDGSAREQP